MPVTSAKRDGPTSGPPDRRNIAMTGFSHNNPDYWDNKRVAAPTVRQSGKSAGRTAMLVAVRLLVVCVGAAIVLVLARTL